ncbi:MAG: TPM domain-containing protein [Bacteriovoracia bacterium]
MQFLLAFVLFFSLNAKGAELKLPQLTSPVMDLAGLMSETEERALSSLAYEIYANNGPQITIATVPDLQGYEIEDFSIRLAEKWQLGSKEKDNGLLVVISKADRKVRIEVGNGIEGEITDYDTARYTRGVFPEHFKRGDFYSGLRLFMEDVAQKFNIKTSEGPGIVRRAPQHTKSPVGRFGIMAILGILAFGSLIFRGRPLARGVFTGLGFTGVSLFMGVAVGMMVAIFIFGLVLGLIGIGNFLTALALSGGRGRYGGGGGFGGGGGWGGGGGGFSGGGSSGSW